MDTILAGGRLGRVWGGLSISFFGGGHGQP
jgi:hypothetical protein